MKIAFIFGSYSIGNRPLDFNTLWTSARGLTGSDLGIIMNAIEMVKLGHDVSLFTIMTDAQPKEYQGVKLYQLHQLKSVIDDTFDAMVSYNEADIFRDLPTKPLRVMSQMLNDFGYCKPGFDDFVDMYTSPCEKHMKYIMPQTPIPEKWKVLQLGCDPTWYHDNRVPGRVVWASSADRGLHFLLQEWGKIKKAVPEAHLRIFYNFNFNDIMKIEPDNNIYAPFMVEMGHRTRYIKEALTRLKSLDVEIVGSVSRECMQKEFSEAMVLAYPVSTVNFTEGFSISIMEACASGTLPVITDCDCIGSIYGDVVPMVKTPLTETISEYSDLVIRALTDKEWHDKKANDCKVFAQGYTWKIAAEKLEKLLIENKKK